MNDGFVLLICGFVAGIVAAYMVMWHRIRTLEDELSEKDKLLYTSVEMLRQERKAHKEWQKVGNKCDSVDFSKKW